MMKITITMSNERPPIITDIKTPKALTAFLEVNQGIIIIKMGAEWCAPCKRIEPLVNSWFKKMPNNVYCAIVDIDTCFELFGFLKKKRVVKGVPTLLAYYKDNTHYVPDDLTSGADEREVNDFFERCLEEVGDI